MPAWDQEQPFFSVHPGLYAPNGENALARALSDMKDGELNL